MDFDAIVLAGGAGSRLGGTDKARLDLLGSPLVARPLAACAAAQHVVLVGPDDLRETALATGLSRDAGRVNVTRENPVGGGPAAATVAAFEALQSLTGDGGAEWIVLLSCDLPLAEYGVRRLLEAAADVDSSYDGLCLSDGDRRLQWLFGIYRRASLRAAVVAHPAAGGLSMRRLLGSLRLAEIPDTADIAGDLDDWADHADWTTRLTKSPSTTKEQRHE